MHLMLFISFELICSAGLDRLRHPREAKDAHEVREDVFLGETFCCLFESLSRFIVFVIVAVRVFWANRIGV